jgi:hypothetical protein
MGGQAADQAAELQMDEAQRLDQLIALQQHEIALLRDEIRRLSRKTGYVLPPSKQGAVEPLPPI